MDILRLFLRKKLICVFLLGIASGLPLLLTISTLTVWLSQVGVSKTAIGIFAIIHIPYSLKFTWSFCFDYFKIPLLSNMFGRRRSWLFVIQVLLFFAIISLGTSSPDKNLLFTGYVAFLVSLLSATQDIIIDAYRIESLREEEQAAGSAMAVYGYRVGMFIAGAGALLISSQFGWGTAYFACATFLLIGSVAAIILGEEKITTQQGEKVNKSIKDFINDAIISPLADFMTRDHWVLILLFVIFFKMSDAMLVTMANNFYVDVGFSANEIALVVKSFGFIMTMVGSALGGYLAFRLNITKALAIASIFQSLSNLVFILLTYTGHDLNALYIVITVENLSGALGNVVIVAYISRLCNVHFTATQYALLSSVSAVARSIFSTPSGKIVELFGWKYFFVFSAILGLPAIIFLYYITTSSKDPKTNSE
jgi:PAT family beta-lactamase induction signal transducer AmpG